MSVWCHLLDRIMGPSIREAYLRGFEYGRNSAVNARQMSPDEMPLNELLQLIATPRSSPAICILDKSLHCLELSVSAGKMVLYLHG